MDHLVDCLNFTDSAVQSSSVEALGMLCCNASAREQVVLGIDNLCNRYYNTFPLQFSSTGNGVASLLQLLHSANQDVVYKATWTLSVCARSPAVAEAICKIG